ncbi:hypothetical protein [Roseburia sp. 499]|uniref:hypothetical protein n=1 Tax=Roseburia sp. 499 TaxID=1261634 RepID=UPI0009535B26|nr:hypothetical protein [Roseburia sp. 499]WVK69576.1 hypothetical protein BIV20_14635 [Roseburia sp. 499]
MRKKSLVVGMVMVMSAMMLNACGGSSKEDYIADVEAITEFSNSAATAASSLDMDAYNSALDDLSMKTKEGKALKADMEEMGDILSDAVDMMENPADVDEDAANELQEKMTKIAEKAEEDTKAFVEAAEESGVEEEDVEDLNLGF